MPVILLLPVLALVLAAGAVPLLDRQLRGELAGLERSIERARRLRRVLGELRHATAATAAAHARLAAGALAPGPDLREPHQ